MPVAHLPVSLLLLAATAFIPSAFAQSPADTTRRSLGEVTVYGTRLAQAQGQTGRHITVISGRSLDNFPVNSLDDLLRCLPALEVQSRGSFGAQADLSLRGSTFNQVLILLDGMRLNDPLSGHFAGYLPITPAEIEQLEIVRGPGAALYGPDAVGGFINIVSKTFAATHRPDEWQAQGTFMAGEWNLKSTNAGFYARQKGLRFGGGVLNNTTDGQLRGAPSGARSDVKLNTYSLSAAADLTPRLSAAARASFDQRAFNAQYFYSTSAADQSRETTSRDWYQGQLRYEWAGGHRTEAQVAGAASTDVFAFTPTAVPADHLMHTLNFQLLHEQVLGPKLRLALGGQADERRIASNDRGLHRNWHTGAFALATAAPTPGLALTAGLRLDRDATYGTVLVPQLNASQALLPQRLTLRAAVGRAIRGADYTERFNNAGAAAPLRSGLRLGNPALEAERTWNYEAGLDYTAPAAAGLTLRATYFRRQGSRQIDYVPNTPGTTAIALTGLANLNPAGSYALAQNLFDVTTQGLETELVASRGVGPGTRLEGRAGYTFVAVRNGQDVVSQYLGNIPKHLVAGSLSVQHRRATLSLSGLWKQRDAQAAAAIGRELTASYAVFHARLEAALLPGRLWGLVQVQNLFNAQYSDLLGAQMPSRWLMGGVRVAVGK